MTLDALVAERRDLDAREAAWLRRVAAYDRSGRARVDGYDSTACALRVECRMTSGAARGHVDVARKLDDLPATAEAFGAGDISRQHANVIAAAYTHERADAIREIEEVLVTTAKRVHPRDLFGIVRHATDALDGDGGASSDARDYALRRLHISTTVGGIGVIDGRGDPLGTEILLTAVNEVMDRDLQASDTRNAAQRRYDALVAICRDALDHGRVGTSRGARPHVALVADLQRVDGTADLVSDARIEAAHVGRLSRNTLDRILCDCSISRVIMAGKSEVLDVGRATRTISPAMWKALVARDGGCVQPGCGKPPGWCEAHHRQPWQRGGRTDLDNLELRCPHHHDTVHNRGP